MEATTTSHIPYSKYNDKKQDEKLLHAFAYFLQVSERNLFSQLKGLLNYWLNIPEDKLINIERIVEMAENALLLLDDVGDNSSTKKGIPAVNSVYGVPCAINTADYVIVIGLERVRDINHPDAVKIYLEQIMEFLRGQGMELYWKSNATCPTEEEYKQIMRRRNGALVILGMKLMQLFSENQADFTKLINILALSYEIRKSFLNLSRKVCVNIERYCEDLTEGKFSLPIIHAINSPQNDDNHVMRILRQKTNDFEVKKYCISLLEKYGSFEYTRKVLEELKREANEEANQIGFNPYLEEVLNVFFKLESI